MYLTATVSLSPDAAAESGGQFSAAWMSAALGQVVAEQPADSPVKLGTNNQVTRCAVGLADMGGSMVGAVAVCELARHARRPLAGISPLTLQPRPPPPAHRAAVCGNGICEVGERTVEGLVDGTCPQDCSFETKVRPVWQASSAVGGRQLGAGATWRRWPIVRAPESIRTAQPPARYCRRRAPSPAVLAHACPPPAPAAASLATLAIRARRAPQASLW